MHIVWALGVAFSFFLLDFFLSFFPLRVFCENIGLEGGGREAKFVILYLP